MMRLQTEASLASSGLTPTSKFVRLALQSLALGLGALLAIEAKVSPARYSLRRSSSAGRWRRSTNSSAAWKNIVQARGAYASCATCSAKPRVNIALTQLPRPEGRLSVENVTVSTLQQRPILGNITFRIAAGEMVAIVGPSGAGKSTLVRALAGAAIARRRPGPLRRRGPAQLGYRAAAEHIGFMPQEPSLFAGTVKENIARFRDRLGEDAGAVDEATVEAAQLAGAHELILRLPSATTIRLGWAAGACRPARRSGSRWRGRCFATPQYIILDEPNSALDAEGDQQLLQTLEALKQRGSTS